MNNRSVLASKNLIRLDERTGRMLRLLAFVLPALVLAINIVMWATTVSAMGGPEVLARRADFVSNLTGATLISEGKGGQLYDLATQHDAQVQIFAPYISLGPNDLLPYNHLPFEAMLVSPLIGLPYPLILLIWSLAMLAALAFALWLMSKTLPVAGQAGLMLLLAVCSYQPLIRSFVLGQNSPLALLGLCGLFVALRNGREGWAGAALVLVALKPQILPVILLVVLLQRHWKALATFVALMTGLSVAVMPLLGVGWPVEYAKLLLGVASWKDTGAIDPGIMANWRGLATHLFGWLPGTVTPLFVLLSALSVLALVWVWLRSRNTPHWNGDLFWALGSVVALLTSLHLNPHDLTLLIFPAWIMSAWALSREVEQDAKVRWLALLWAGYAVALVGPPLPFVLLNVGVMCAAAFLLARRLLAYPSLAARSATG
jgi:hypothetical protein